MLDALVALPIICFICIKDKKEALLKSLALGCIAIFIGSYIVPEPNKIIWTYLESGRYFILAIVLLFELTAILTVYFALKTAIRQQHDPDISIENSINKYFGEGTIATLLSFEVRMWSYALLASKVQTTHFIGEHYFSYHEKDGAQSNLLGFALLIAFEMPLMHLLIHFTYSPLAANIITFLTLFSLVFFIAEYRAVSRRPISLAKNKLIIRYGLFQPLTLD
ncbi:hypothetical protein [Shewanella sairae]|nr:hypothetical protein [Shewanella sairae]